MGSLKLLSLNPLWLLIVGVVGFGGWVAYDATRPLPTPNRHALADDQEEPVFAPDKQMLFVAHDRPPLHHGMPRQVAERVLASATKDDSETDTVGGVPVVRVSYLLTVPGDGPVKPTCAPHGWSRVTVEYQSRHPAQPILNVSAVPVASPAESHSSLLRVE